MAQDSLTAAGAGERGRASVRLSDYPALQNQIRELTRKLAARFKAAQSHKRIYLVMKVHGLLLDHVVRSFRRYNIKS